MNSARASYGRIEGGRTLNKRHRDFTIGKYGELCHTLLDAGYTPTTVYGYLAECPASKVAVLRHDVARKVGNALRMAELEHALGVRSTYYFRYPNTYKPAIIRKIHSLGHEVGYHYETLAKAKGDSAKAMALFINELEEFKALCDVRTVCMHGSPMPRYDNRDLWKEYDFKEYGIAGEAHLSLMGKGLCYLTDTGRDWNGKRSLRDSMPGAKPPVGTTDEFIGWLGSAEESIYLTAHPERWANGGGEWTINMCKDGVVNVGKAVVSKLIGVSKRHIIFNGDNE